MGNDLGKSTNRMAIGAMASATHFGKKELEELQKKFFELAQREGNPWTINREEFREALELVGIAEADNEIIDRLFSMFDKTGNDHINWKEFVVGLAPLCHGTVEEKLTFAFHLYDLDGTGQIKPGEMESVLTAINETASYFGDPVVKREEIKTMVDDVFRDHATGTGVLEYRGFMAAVAEHPVIVQFISGKGTVRYGSGM